MDSDTLFMNQTEIYEYFTKFYTNVKKDGSERKTVENYKRKAETVEAYWKNYQKNHREMCEIANFEHVYFKRNCFDTAQEVYLNIKQYIDKTLEQLGKKHLLGVSPRNTEAEEGPSGHETSSRRGEEFAKSEKRNKSLEELVKKQTINFKAFMRTVGNLQIDNLENKWQFENALKSLDNRWSEIDKLHWQIEGEDGSEDYFYQKEFCKHEETYIKLTNNINMKMWSTKHREKSTPQINIPVFNGLYNNWVCFKDLFTEAIDKNPSMSNAQKMQFLKGKVSGEAERLIHHLQISSDNYHVCWDILNHRYGNKKMIFTSHINIMLGLPSMQQQSVTMIKRLHDVTKETLHAIQNLGVEISTWDPILVHLLSQKLDNESFIEYIESVKNPRELPSLQEFLDYLEVKFTALEASRRKQEPVSQKTTVVQPPKVNNYNHNQRRNFHKNNYHSFIKENTHNSMNTCHVSRSITCGLCNAEHGIWRCPEFLQMTSEQKLNKVEQLSYCLNCLSNHFRKPCLSNKRCRKCLGNHNTLLHESIINRGTSSSEFNTKTTNTKNIPSRSSHASWDDISEILLATAVVYVKGTDGTQHKMRALIDQGSQLSLINENAAQTLGLKRSHFKGQIYGVGEKESNSKGMLHLSIQSLHSEFSLQTSVIIMNNLIKRLPNNSFKKPTTWKHIQGISLADPEFYISRPVDLLLGADIYSQIVLGGILRGDRNDQPIAQQTQLGWLLCGSMTPHYQCNVVLNNAKDLLKYWENEDINQKTEITDEDRVCVKYFHDTTRRLENGGFEVRLPFKPDYKNKLGLTKPQAIAQYRNLEKRFQKNKELKEEYHKFMAEYISLNHMIPSHDNQSLHCYLPHHAVIRAESTTTKLRVVFNASATSTSGYSLNDLMYRGPNIQKDIQEIILKWRQYRYVYTSDIEKMYRAIRLHPEDQIFQKIIWRRTNQEEITKESLSPRSNQEFQSFQLVTLTYGTKPAGFLAMMCLKKLASDERHIYPEAARELEDRFYMDDYCGGHHSLSMANKVKNDLIKLLQLGEFNLRKWTSNSLDLLRDLRPEQCNQSTYEFKESGTTKTLGLGWNPQKDKFIFTSTLISEQISKDTSTKRSLLSDISKLYDPLGWLTPLSTTMKILFQNVWLSKLKWDETLPVQINSEWNKIKREFDDLKGLEINRWLGTSEGQAIQLHGFCDASNKAYACVVYCKTTKGDKVTITLVAGKARLAPLGKNVTIPRLELMGAQLLSSLMQKVEVSLPDYKKEVYCWTDSTAVLGWLQGDPTRWKPFVANRVTAITKIIPPTNWHHVKTDDNPADCASRGLTVKQLKDHTLWWQGPPWLLSYSNQDNKYQTIYQTDLEIKPSIFRITNLTLCKQQKDITIAEIVNHLLKKFSSIAKIIRIFAWILRLTTTNKQTRRTYLELHELRYAKLILIKCVQGTEFINDFLYLGKHGKVHCKSNILNLNPFIDEHGILRVGGRLNNAHINTNVKHPIILPHDHILTTLLINQAHELTLHGGVRLTLANLRQQYWIMGGYMATKKYIRNCVVCRRHNPMKQFQLMGDLPEPRVNPEHAFYHCGVDYTGFVEVKANKGRGIKTTKGYIAVFVCMVTKAVHLELVSDLSSSAFLAALTRMSARRGAPRHVYSDNGTNFVGANRILQEEHNQLISIFNDTFIKEITEMGISWHFNAPSWPNAGGLWERAVRSLKHHLKRVVGTQKLTFEEYTTLLAKLEACLNSRPLCALTEDPDDLDYLTPAHFLSGRPGTTIIETEQDARTRWFLTTKIFKDLWKRWKMEYLVQLSSRAKWMNVQKNIDVGDLVIIHNENLPSGKWPLGRVVQTHPGSDGLVRTVSLKTSHGLITRPIVKLSLLPVNQNKSKPNQLKPKQNHTSTSVTHKREGRKVSKLSTIASILLIFMAIISPSYSLHSIKQIPSNQTLYFDPITKIQLIRDKWTIVMYYDMSPFWSGIETYEKISTYLETLCSSMKLDSHCNTIVQQARHDYQELKYYNELLVTQHFDNYARRRRAYNQTYRRRRGLINGVGYLASELFGVLDSRFAEQYVKDIETIQRNEKHLSYLWKNQTSVIEAEFNLMKEMEVTINKQHKIINKKIMDLQENYSTVQQEILNITYLNDFTLSAMAGNTLLLGLRRLQDTLLNTITDVYHGQINIHLLPPKQLKRELQTIYSKIPSELTLPISNLDNDIQYIYKLIQVKARATRKYVIIEVTFPLISRENFQLYKIIPVPHQTKNIMTRIIPVSEYVAVNIEKESYFITDMNQLTTCLHHRSAYICQLPNPILDLKNDESFCQTTPDTNECKVDKTSCSDKWVELNLNSQHFFFCCNTYTIKIICGDQVTISHLSQAGVIGISQDCVIKGKGFSFYSIRQQSSSMNITSNIYIPQFDQINRIINIRIPEYDQSQENLTTYITSLEKAVKELKNSNTEVEDLSPHDIHHYTISYIMILVTLCAVLVWVWKTGRCRSFQRPATTGRTTHTNEETIRPVVVTDPPPVPTQRSQPCNSFHSTVTVPSTPVGKQVYSEVLSASDLNDKHRINFDLQNLAKRWPSARYGAIKRTTKIDDSVV